MRVFKYDVLDLIHAIKDRPCLWDRTLEVYKDRTERRTAWEDVFAHLDENYQLMTAEEKRVTGEIILNKWTNIRDTFVKTLKNKTRMGRPRRKYVLYDHLKFLIKVTSTEEDFSIDYASEDSAAYVKVERESPKETTTHKKRSKKIDYSEQEPKKPKVDKSDEDYIEVDEYNDPRIMNEDEAFFASLLPSVVRYSENERLEFRIEVLAVMKKIKDKREWTGDV